MTDDLATTVIQDALAWAQRTHWPTREADLTIGRQLLIKHWRRLRGGEVTILMKALMRTLPGNDVVHRAVLVRIAMELVIREATRTPPDAMN